MSETDRLLEAGLADYLKAAVPDDTHLGTEVQAKLAERARPRTVVEPVGWDCWLTPWGRGERLLWDEEWFPLSVVLMVMMAIAFGAIIGAGNRAARRMVMFVSVVLGGVVFGGVAVVQHVATDGTAFGPAAAVMITLIVGVIGMLLTATLVDGGGGIDDDPMQERTPRRRER